MEINRIHVLELEQDNTSLQAFQINDANETVENAFAYGTEVEAIAPSSQAFGTKTQAGCLGYYISAITKDSIYLSREKVSPKAYLRKNDTPEELAEENKIIAQCYQENFNSGLPNGTFICHIQANGYYQWPFITVSLGKAYNEKTNSNRLSYDYMNTIPQSSQKYWFQDTKDPSHDKRKVQPHILYCLETPMAGVIPVGANAHAEGNETLAAADDTHTEGCGTRAAGRYAHAEGGGTQAGYAAHSEGYFTQAKGFYSHAEGYGTEAQNSQTHAEGYVSIASGKIAHAEGCNTIAEGFASHAEGRLTKALGESSHTEGRNTIAEGFASHASGFGTIATKTASHVIGRYNERDDKNEYLFIIGNGVDDKTRSNAMTVDASGNIITKGSVCIQKADGTYEALAKQSEIVNAENFVKKNEAIGRVGSNKSGEIFNDYTNNEASKQYAHAEGNRTKASGDCAHAEGYITIAEGDFGAHAEGNQTYAEGNSSHAEGRLTKAKAQRSHAEGNETTATRSEQHVQGRYNYLDSNEDAGNYAHIVGNGTKDEQGNVIRSNAHTLDWDGNAWYKGRIQCGGTQWDDDVVGRVPCVFEGSTEPDKITGSYNNGDFYIYKTQNSSAGEPKTIILDTEQMYTAYSANTNWNNNNDQTLYLGITISPYIWWYGKIQFTAPDDLPAGTKITFNLPGIQNSLISGAISTTDITYTSIKDSWTSSFSTDAFISGLTFMSNNSSQIQITLTQNITKDTSLYFYVGFTENGNTKGASTSFSSITASYTLPSGLITTAGIYIRILDTWLKLNETSITTPS